MGGGKTTKGLALAAAILTLTALLLSGMPFQPARANPDWWDPAWSCRKAITVTESSGATLTDYQVKIDIGYATAMRPDFGDLRFTNASGLPLDYWLESKVDSSSATVWVKVDSIAASANTIIYMYYGYPTAGDASDGDATFEFFDDFEDGDISDWSQYGSGTVTITSDGGNYVLLKTANNDKNGGYCPFNNGSLSDFEAVFRTKRISENGGNQNRYGIEDSSFNGYGPRMADFNSLPSAFAIERRTGGGGSTIATKNTSEYQWNTWMTVQFRKHGGTIDFELYDSSGSLVEFISAADASYNSFDRFVVHGGWEFYTDDIRVAKYVSPEPAWSIGLEECNSAPDPPGSLGPAAYVDGSWVDDNAPTLNFTQSDPDGNTVSYTIQIDDTDNTFSSLVVDYTSELLAEGPVSFTVGQAAGMGTYNAGVEGQTLNDSDYFWRVMSTDEHVVAGGWSVANGGAIAFRLNTGTEIGWTSKDIYSTRENVEVGGSGFPQNSNVDVYVVAEGEWLGGETIAGYGIVAMKNFATDGSGNFGPGVIWQSPLEVGEYDVVFDADCNGDYDEIPDFVDHPNHPGFTVVRSMVGGEVYPVDKAALLLPWLGLGVAMVLAAGGLILVRRVVRLR